MMKSEVYQACLDYGIADISKDDYKFTMWSRLREHIGQHVQPFVVSMAMDRGHDVVYNPLSFSELQPIEMIWANVKDGAIIHYTIENSNTYLLALDKKLREADAVEEIGDDVFSDSAMDSPSCGNDDCSESSDDNEANNGV
ncbi:hypothetical protein AC1031_020675 [Aphanomyces cochlioides]|nr:hypothetical protein AC1031_020675 [Aphanomyces cochlioides]